MKITPIEERELERYLDAFNYSEYIADKTFLITGFKGLVGTGITKWLLYAAKRGGYDVEIIGSTRQPSLRPDYLSDDDKVQLCQFGYEREYCQNRTIDYIIHSASPTGNTYHKAHPVESLRTIVDSTEVMLSIMQDHPKAAMIYLSSEEVYGLPKSEEPIKEDYVGAIDSLTTRSCYPLGKKASELMCSSHHVEYGTNVKIIRPTVIHGLFQPYTEQRVANEILRCVVEGKDLELKSAGTTKKCLMYSLDAVAAILTVLFKGVACEAYNASNPDTYMSVRDLASHIFDTLSPELNVRVPESDTSVAAGYLPQRTLLQDVAKLQSLGWRLQTNLEDIYRIDIERFASKGVNS